MNDIVLNVLGIGLLGMAVSLYTRHGWRVEGVLNALVAVFLIGALIFNIVYFVSDPSSKHLFFMALPLVLPALFLVLMIVDTSSPDPFTPAPPEIREAFDEIVETYETAGWYFKTASMRRRSFGIAQLVFVHPADEIIAVVAGGSAERAHVWLFSQIGGHFAVLTTVNHGSGARPPGELRQWLPGADVPGLIDAHKKAADFLRSHGFTVGVDVDGDPLDFLGFWVGVDRQNRRRPGRYLLGVAFGDLFFPRSKPLAEQRDIERRLAQLPTL